ncbi:MAG: NAD-binding protein [Phycisphaerales bacterium]|nr:NAD-binding protein [Phycisphaerales bacterium]
MAGGRISRRNTGMLLRFIGALVAMVTVYSVLFHWIMLYEGREYSWVSGFYWTLVTMSTLGFGDITFKSDLGRVFSIVVVLSGTVFMLIVLPFAFIQFFLAPWLEEREAARTPRSLPEDTAGHVILTRYDAVGESLVRRLEQFGHSYAVVCPDLPEAQRLNDLGVKVMLGEPDDPETYRRARAEKAAMVFTSLPDAANTNVAFTVREVTDRTPVVATATDAASIPILQLAGSSSVLQLREVLAQALARGTVGGNAMTHVVGQVDELLIAEASVRRTPLVGQTLRQSGLRDLGVSVVGFWERGEFSVATPDAVIRESVVLVLAGSAEQLQNYDEAFAIYNVSRDPVLVLGGGSLGRAAARALQERGIDVRIVEQDPSRVRDAERTVVGNAADAKVLERAGIRKAPAVLVTTHDDSINLFLTIFCRRLRPDVQIIARVTAERNVRTLHRAGADFVLSFASMGAGSVLNLLKGSRLVTVTEGLEVFRTPVPRALVGRTIAQSGVREKTGCTIVALREKAGGPLQTNPAANTPLADGDELVLAGDTAARERFTALAG